jgi:hypothetical protein
MSVRALLASGLVLLCAPVLRAQSPLVPIPNLTYIGVNPLGIPFDVGSIELESAVAPGVTLGGLASYTDVSNDRFTTFDFKVRYYPGDIVLKGFSAGLSVGYLRYSTLIKDTDNVPQTSSRQSLIAPTIGVLADYNWMLGRSQRFLVGTGIGAKRVLTSTSERNRVQLGRAYPTVRFIVGFAF